MIQRFLPFKLVTNQIEASPLCLDSFNNGVMDQCIKEEISPMIWSPLAGGKLLDVNFKEKNAEKVREALKKVGSQLELDLDQTAVSWLLRHPSKPVVILGTNKIERIEKMAHACSAEMDLQQWFSIYEASLGSEVP